MDEKSIYILKRLYESDFVSGEKMAQELQISRMAINKKIKTLSVLGYNIECAKKKGYSLLDKDIIRTWEIEDLISKSSIFNRFIYFPSIDSTNNYLKAKLEDFESGTIVFAERQQKGRGRRERTWVDIEKGIKMSILLRVDLSYADKVIPLTLFTGLIINRVLRKYYINSFIKWPNDIYLNNKKVCGILSELSGELEGRGNVILGIGMNVNAINIPGEIKDIATSLRRETNTHFDRTSIVIDILNEFEHGFGIFVKEGFRAYRDDYKSQCLNIGKEVLVNGVDKMFCMDVGENGELICKKDDEIIKLQSGEVTIRF